MSSLMAVATASLVIPACLFAVLTRSNNKAAGPILLLSRGTSIILLGLYVMYLYFQLGSHAALFSGRPKSDDAAAAEDGVAGGASTRAGEVDTAAGEEEEEEDDEGEHHEGETLSPVAATIWLVGITIVVAVCAEYLVGSIDAIVQTAHVSKTFIGLILIPIVGNAAEHVTAVIVAGKGKMDLAISVALGSSLQIALLVTPFLVVLGWAIGQPMSLHFQIFETVIFFLSTLVVSYLLQDGKSNYLEGAMLLGT
jgi:Ca2+:H+ antiporter